MTSHLGKELDNIVEFDDSSDIVAEGSVSFTDDVVVEENNVLLIHALHKLF